MKKAVVLLSGGLDSTTCLALAKSQGFACYALSFSYGQRHSAELCAATRIAKHMGAADHKIVALDIALFGGSALTDASIEVPEFKESLEIPVTYVPARNTIFLAMALGYAESIGARDIFIGASSVDYSHYPDCRPEFIESFQSLANLATKAGIEGDRFTINAPLQYLSKVQTIQLGAELGVDYGLTVSCYQANEAGEACGQCDSCTFRKRGFKSAGVDDPTRYQKCVHI
ncbi:7-cyano-7-deazaguanine synthase QueC [Legionella pneumophila serogroup 1]|uniref:7-cyano-7-deazaguanine synthase QueC n=1 Tax=Legionella pneumophila TaxID=446 RepID=UPI0004846314|nr:7-cyano-7-deazaguanine synthase QueC [Legionella pneumophila]SNW01949.1 ExsB protein [Legionella pneumophila]VEB31855.1 ExsB protein [Legionella pneumophila]BCZ98614.1 7-cyano-7-deazaguanine synthase [Legionella pneumophila]HAT1942578.1 7-cyano-7-deazaguanine synthase QueC [Legionella pneumophila]HAT3861999.1 7-cyano-7-deazaguanine synthase QueC [Legionella pneumophila]